MFDKLPFFKDKHPQLLQTLLPHMKLEYYMANEYVVWQNDRSTQMFFISDGLVEPRVSLGTAQDSRAPPPQACFYNFKPKMLNFTSERSYFVVSCR